MQYNPVVKLDQFQQFHRASRLIHQHIAVGVVSEIPVLGIDERQVYAGDERNPSPVFLEQFPAKPSVEYLPAYARYFCSLAF
jgi:hypothetical protein